MEVIDIKSKQKIAAVDALHKVKTLSPEERVTLYAEVLVGLTNSMGFNDIKASTLNKVIETLDKAGFISRAE
jgi:hypothetical protein